MKPPVLIDLSLCDVLKIEVDTLHVARPGGTWTCAGCGERRLMADSRRVILRNRVGPPHERPVLLCADCVGKVSVS
jgi:hypothetical protein